MKRLARRAALAFAFWTAVGLVFALPQLRPSANVDATIASALAQWWSWGLLAPAIIAVDRALPFSASQLGRRLVTHLVIGPVVIILCGYLLVILRCMMGLQGWSQLLGETVLAAAGREIF
ncbi:MAG: sensor histidine kinase, partial [Acidobacteriaceae bacterium]